MVETVYSGQPKVQNEFTEKKRKFPGFGLLVIVAARRFWNLPRVQKRTFPELLSKFPIPLKSGFPLSFNAILWDFSVGVFCLTPTILFCKLPESVKNPLSEGVCVKMPWRAFS